MVKIEDLPKTHKYIYDENIEPMFLGKDTSVGGGYILYLRKDVEQKTGDIAKYAKVIGYPSTFSHALKMIVRDKLKVTGPTTYNSIREYLNEWKQINEESKNLIDL